MFDNYVFSEGTCTNYKVDGNTLGFEMKTRITYYRGIPCSMIHCIEVEVDGQQIAEEDILFSPDQKEFFTVKELTTLTTYKWEYGEEAIVRVKKQGGLETGEHEVTLKTGVRTAYIPVPLIGVKKRTITITN